MKPTLREKAEWINKYGISWIKKYGLPNNSNLSKFLGVRPEQIVLLKNRMRKRYE